jgi:hypothetical protein
MKKMIINMLFLFGISAAVSAQAYDPVPMAVTPANQPQNNAWYNASQNANSTDIYRTYWTWDKTSLTWVMRVEVLVPAKYVPSINADPRYKLVFKGDDVCTNDACLRDAKTRTGGQ